MLNLTKDSAIPADDRVNTNRTTGCTHRPSMGVKTDAMVHLQPQLSSETEVKKF